MNSYLSKLKMHLDRRRKEREEYKKLLVDREARDKEIDSAPLVASQLGFWCSRCQKDFIGKGIKIVESDWTLTGARQAYYQGFCPKHHRAVRRITDKAMDPYFIRSKLLRRQRVDQAKDILQYGDFGFKMLYGDINHEH